MKKIKVCIEKIKIFIEILKFNRENHHENHWETAQIAASGFLKHSARNQPNSRLRFLSASFYVLELYRDLSL